MSHRPRPTWPLRLVATAFMYVLVYVMGRLIGFVFQVLVLLVEKAGLASNAGKLDDVLVRNGPTPCDFGTSSSA
jgi:hypothetical protein